MKRVDVADLDLHPAMRIEDAMDPRDPALAGVEGFLCLIHLARGLPADPEPQDGAVRLLSGAATAVVSECAGPMTVFAGHAGPHFLRPLVRTQFVVGTGTARLDNREDVQAQLACANECKEVSDLELVFRAIERFGDKSIPALIGDFAFVLLDTRTRQFIAARDALGVKPIYYRRLPSAVLFASRASLLAGDRDYDLRFVGQFLLGQGTHPERTMFSKVAAVPPASIVRLDVADWQMCPFWSPLRFTTDYTLTGHRAIEAFRHAFLEAIASSISPTERTWAELSGGLDSSSIVSSAEWLHESGRLKCRLAGTISFSDLLDSSHEREFSDSVSRHWQLRNEVIIDNSAWQDDRLPPPITDLPTENYIFFVRDRSAATLLSTNRAIVLLSGYGADQYLAGSLFYLADLLAHGRLEELIREATRWSHATKLSAWRILYRCGLLPLLPPTVRRRIGARIILPVWLRRDFVRRFGLERFLTQQVSDVAWGDSYATNISRALFDVSSDVNRGVLPESITIRYPFLRRTLVELSLRLPPTMRTQPHGGKWILREAMRGIVPDPVLTRTTKSYLNASIARSLRLNAERLDAMFKDSVLADLGCIEPEELRVAIDETRRGFRDNSADVLATLALETWLEVQSGRWPAPSRCST